MLKQRTRDAMQKTHTKKLQGFSIIELTIVLIVIGLMTSAVLVGAKLISEAKIRQLSTLLSETENAIYGFKMQYTYLPGDFPIANKQWNVAELNEKCRLDDNGILKDFDANSSATVNGNGSTLVENDGKTSSDAGVVWCHLALAKFVKKSETIATTALKPKHDGAFLPNGLVYNVGNSLYLIGSETQTSQYDVGNHMYLFGKYSSNNASPFAPSNTNLTARELAAIDSKLDDGKPGDGRITMFSVDNKFGNRDACCAGISGSRCEKTSKYQSISNIKNACYMRYSSKLFN